MSWLLLMACLTGTRGTGGETTLSTEPPGGLGGEDTGEGQGGPGGGGGGGDGTTADDDADGDGYSDGEDCDDSDPQVHPMSGPDEECDDIDSDCDGAVDEDAAWDDYEEEDNQQDGVDLGDLTEDTAKITTFLTPEGDVDDYYLYLDDGIFSWFDLDLDLDVPSGLDMVIELYWYDDSAGDWLEVGYSDEGGDGRNESLTYEGGTGSSDTGWYAVRLYGVYGASCAESYTLHIEG